MVRTRRAIVDAYNHLIQHRRQRSIKVADIVARANVGRSTFYEHYAGADDVFMEAVAGPLALLADAAAGASGGDTLDILLRHFWENRQRARDVLSGRQGERISRLLADLIGARLPDDDGFVIPSRLVALHLSEAMLAPIQGWLMAEAPCAPDQLAAALCASATASREALAA